jgi:hypothetical protein
MDTLDVTQLTSPTLLPFGTDWQLIIYSFVVGFLISLLLCGGIWVVSQTMKNHRAESLPIEEPEDFPEDYGESLESGQNSYSLGEPSQAKESPSRAA